MNRFLRMVESQFESAWGAVEWMTKRADVTTAMGRTYEQRHRDFAGSEKDRLQDSFEDSTMRHGAAQNCSRSVSTETDTVYKQWRGQ